MLAFATRGRIIHKGTRVQPENLNGYDAKVRIRSVLETVQWTTIKQYDILHGPFLRRARQDQVRRVNAFVK